ncbi:MAG: glycosyltransferase family 39 protein [Candidatus Kerfeldbacteria bacterium]|nr:glycosyltransferase family 39 protein [Candidatus Kerfeldbacteria bacterium]
MQLPVAHAARQPLTTVDRWLVGFALGWFLMFGTLAAFVTHTFTFFPDSRQHYHYISVIRSGSWPYLENSKIHQEEHQPPLYYVLMAPAAAIGERLTPEGGVLLVRLLTLLIGAGVVVLTARLAREVFPARRYVPGLAALIVGMNPQYYVMSAEVNNDALTSLLGASLLLMMVWAIQRDAINPRRDWWIGGLLATTFLTKMSLWPLVLMTLAVFAVKRRGAWRQLWRLAVPTILLGGPWLVRNTLLYGDPTVWGKLQQYFGAEQYADFLTPAGVRVWFNLLFETYWARFRHFTAGLPFIVYAWVKIVWGLAVVGLIAWLIIQWRRLPNTTRASLVVLAASIVVVAVGVFTYSLKFYQPQGRYLFPVQAAIALFLALGLDSIAPPRLKPVLVGGTVLGLLVFNIIALRMIVFWG